MRFAPRHGVLRRLPMIGHSSRSADQPILSTRAGFDGRACGCRSVEVWRPRPVIAGDVTVLPGVTETAALRVAMHACRSLLEIGGPEDAAEVAQRLVADLGGRVVDAHLSGLKAVPVDVSFGHRITETAVRADR